MNKEIKRGKFQWPFRVIKFEMIISGDEDQFCEREIGEKKGKVGIREEFQTEREENLWILWQAP